MSLTLTVTSYRGQSPSQPMVLTLDRKGASIGRASDNNWVLPDPDKYVSIHHATIEYRDNTYYITDNSSNGVFILPSEVPLGRSNSTKLFDGDQLGIGEYQVMVSVTADEFLSPGPAAASLFDAPKNTHLAQDPFMDLGADPIANMIDDDNLTDNFSTPEEAVDLDFFAPSSPSSPEKSIAAESDHVPALDEAFSPVRGIEAPQLPPISEAPEAPSDNIQADFLPENWLEEDALGEAPKEPPTPPQNLPPEPLVTISAPVRKPAPATPRLAPAAPQPSSITPPDSTKSGIDQDIIQRFCQGAGIHDELVQQLTPETFFTIGKMLRIAISGTMDVLLARTRIKSEMRLDVTTIRAEENNPIKFSINADEALTRLMENEEHRGYMEPVRALEEAFDDIKAHQIAVIAGMQTALQSVLKRFDPERLETRLQKQSPISASIPIHKQAKLWSQFEQFYEDIETEAQDDFNQLFSHSFASAYEQQIQQLKAERPLNGDG